MAAVFAIALLLRWAYLFKAGSPPNPDSPTYMLLGENLVRHGVLSIGTAEPLVPYSLRPPVYPAFLGFFHTLLGFSSVGVAAVQGLLDSITALIVIALARRVCTERIALLAGLAYAFSPGSIVYGTKIMAETFFSFECAVAILLAVLAVERKSLRLVSATGVMLALATLTRPLGALLIPLTILLFAWFWRRESKQNFLAPALACALAAAVVIVPWSTRCTMLAGRVVLLQSYGSMNLFMPTLVEGENIRQTNVYTALYAHPVYQPFLRAVTPADYAAADPSVVSAAIANIRRDPVRYLHSRALVYPTLFYPRGNTGSGEAAPPRIILYGVMAYSLLSLVLAVMSLRRTLKSPVPVTAFCAMVWIYTALIHLPMWIEYRFWVPVTPYVIVSAAAAVSCWMTQSSEKGTTSVVP